MTCPAGLLPAASMQRRQVAPSPLSDWQWGAEHRTAKRGGETHVAAGARLLNMLHCTVLRPSGAGRNQLHSSLRM